MSNEVQVQDDFGVMVMMDVKGLATDVQVAMLKDRVDEWVDQLIALLRDVDIQFSARKAQTAAVRVTTHLEKDHEAWMKRQQADADWRLKAARYKASIEARLRYARSLRV